MSQQSIKLIAIDMDGTLLNSQKELTQETIEVLHQAVAKGIKVVLCTGRPKPGVVSYIDQLGFGEADEYAILDNGCTVYQLKDWSLVAHQALAPAEMAELVAAAAAYPEISVTFFDADHYFIVGEEIPELVAYDAGLVFTHPVPVTLEEVQASPVPIFQGMFMGEAPALDRFQAEQGEALSQAFSTVRSQSYIYEALPLGTTKAKGLLNLTQHLGIAPEEVMAIGDAANDLEMLAFAGFSVAMGNASDEVKAVADAITSSNDEAGVARAIEKWVICK
ncbi:Cof-type HAD-IIB family hydrolase [Streptococcus ovuberis]|uniref:HAD family phosphatase n=1 Tax=Streptococcus ovuberis TaxID=1936207 RepID=A0A7X6N389_9STRE|nr:Cof-type HAD-IIB family hydrolase [Streptococcus ovuberis]NKZ21339.1 HAD family phosphatase [Streptococcus ovuberis]